MSELIQTILDEIPDTTLPQPDMISIYYLENRRDVFLDTDVGDDLIRIQRLIMRWNIEDAGKKVEDRKPIHIYIMSYGGDVDYMWSMIDTIEASTTPIYTVNVGIACSAASLIFMSGQKRYMFKNARVVIHEGSAQLSGDAVKVMDQSASYKEELKRMKEYILDRTNIPKTQLAKKRNNDWELRLKECLEYNVCTDVVESLDSIV